MQNRFTALLLILALTMLSQSAHASELFINPDCPSPAQEVAALAYVDDGPRIMSYPFSSDYLPKIARNGQSIRIEAVGAAGQIGGAPPSEVVYPLGTLPAGAYKVELYLKFHTGPHTFGVPQLALSKEFVVQENPPACTPAEITALNGSLRLAIVGQGTDEPLRVLVTDAQGGGVPNITVRFDHGYGPQQTVPPD